MEQPEFCTTKFVTIFGHYQVFVPGNSLTRSRETRIPPGRELINFATPKFKNNSRASTQATTTSLSLFFKEPIKERQTTINSNNKKLQAPIKQQETKQTNEFRKKRKEKQFMPTKSNNTFSRPASKETKLNKEIREKRFKDSFKTELANIEENPHTESPTNWKEHFDINHAKKHLKPLNAMIIEMTTALASVTDVTELSNLCGGLLMATSNSGQKGKLKWYHNLSSVGPKTTALEGLEDETTALEAKGDKLLEAKITPVPTLEAIANIPAKDRANCPKNLLEQTPISNSIMLPQDFASYITRNELPTKSNDLLDILLRFLEVQDKQEGIVTYTYKNLEDEDPIQDSENEGMDLKQKHKEVMIDELSNIHKNKIFIQTLFKWSTNYRSLQIATKENEDESINRWSIETNRRLKPNQTPLIDEVTNPKPKLPSPKGKHPDLNLTGGIAEEIIDLSGLKTNLFNPTQVISPSTPIKGLPPQTNKGGPQITPPVQQGLGNQTNASGNTFNTQQQQNQTTQQNQNQNLNQNHQNQQPIQQNQNQNPLQNQSQQNQMTLQFQEFQKFLQWKSMQQQQNTTPPPVNTNQQSPFENMVHQTMLSIVNINEKANTNQEMMIGVQESIAKMKEETIKNKITEHTSNFLKCAYT